MTTDAEIDDALGRAANAGLTNPPQNEEILKAILVREKLAALDADGRMATPHGRKLLKAMWDAHDLGMGTRIEID